MYLYLWQVGGATAIGEQPIKGLVDPACGARMTVGEALTNLVFATITDLKVAILNKISFHRSAMMNTAKPYWNESNFWERIDL